MLRGKKCLPDFIVDPMPTRHPVPVVDWQTVIRAVTGCQTGKIDRRRAFDATLALLRGSIKDQERAKNHKFGELKQSTNAVAKKAATVPTIIEFLEGLRSLSLKSLGIHVVDPIAGRLSAIWAHPNEPTADRLSESEVYARAWNRIYRHLFRPSATLINAIESGVLPWQWSSISLPTVAVNRKGNSQFYSRPFFRDTRKLARELRNTIHNSIRSTLRKNPDPSNSRHVQTVVQSASNDLEKSDFKVRLDRIAARFRDEVIDDKRKRGELCDYLKKCDKTGDVLPLALKNPKILRDTKIWSCLLDIVQALQSSVLSYPEFCDENGLWVHRVELSNSPSPNRTSLYFIFGLTSQSQDEQLDFQKESFGNLGKALDSLIEMPTPVVTDPPALVKLLSQEVKDRTNSDYQNGLQRWLCAVERLMKDAKHEGHPITYNVGFGSLAYAQSHLHRYEPAPPKLSRHDVPVEKIASYIKAFYSIFGQHTDRGLWFDELGCYRGVFESTDKRDFEKTKASKSFHAQHEDTVLFAKIDGIGLVDIIGVKEITNQKTNRIARVKNGELVDLVCGDTRRTKAMEALGEKIPPKFRQITNWLVHQLVELLQTRTHGTSFIISFHDGNSATKRQRSKWRSTIETQAKTLIPKFSCLQAPLATYDQLKNYAEKDSRPEFLYFMAELANLDGGLRLLLSKTEGLQVWAAQQFIPLLKFSNKERTAVRLLDLQSNEKFWGSDSEDPKIHLPLRARDAIEDLSGLKSLFAAINDGMDLQPLEKEKYAEAEKYVKALSFLDHSGTKTHSLWGMSITAAELCLCVVISSDGNVYIFHDGREFTRL